MSCACSFLISEVALLCRLIYFVYVLHFVSFILRFFRVQGMTTEEIVIFVDAVNARQQLLAQNGADAAAKLAAEQVCRGADIC